ncbi:hypothetical protein FACS1894174_03630 [Bacteroidia bacterium]|nr:hypothetical protein FACS189455_1140 [Bacteroidia bacterium]GHV20944.1 hypothetical protein FACS1894174_03630 [Bacteroidia bacterium]
MMKTKKSWFVIALAVILSGSMAGCIGEGSNSRDFSAIPSYVTMSDGKVGLKTLVGNVYASGLSYDQLDAFGIAWFNINYDQQPAGTDGVKVPYTATMNAWLPVPSGYIRTESGEIPGYYNDTIFSASVFYSQLLNNHAFFVMDENAPSNRKYTYYLTFNTDSTTKYGTPMLYMQTEITDSGSGSVVESLDCPYAFNMSSLMHSSYAKDSTVDNIECSVVRFNLYYQSGVEKTTNKPIFRASSNNPQLILVPKDNSEY